MQVQQEEEREQRLLLEGKSHNTTVTDDAAAREEAATARFQLHVHRLKLLSKLLYSLSAITRNNARNQQVLFSAIGGRVDTTIDGNTERDDSNNNNSNY